MSIRRLPLPARIKVEPASRPGLDPADFRIIRTFSRPIPDFGDLEPAKETRCEWPASDVCLFDRQSPEGP